MARNTKEEAAGLVCIQCTSMAENPVGQSQDVAGAGPEAPPVKSAKQLKKEAKKEAKLAKFNEKMSKMQQDPVNFHTCILPYLV